MEEYSQSKIQELEKENERLRGAEVMARFIILNIDEFLDPLHPIRHLSHYIKLKQQFKGENNI